MEGVKLGVDEIKSHPEVLRLKAIYLQAIEDYNNCLDSLYDTNGIIMNQPEILYGRSVMHGSMNPATTTDLRENLISK